MVLLTYSPPDLLKYSKVDGLIEYSFDTMNWYTCLARSDVTE